VARNRKRAKERRARRPQSVTAAARVADDAAPDPIEHASPDVELAEAQLAVGRPENVEDSSASEAEFEREAEESAEAAEAADDGTTASRSGETSGAVAPAGRSDEASGAVAPAPAAAPPAHRENIFVRLIAFLQGSWRELQRVQWPDRRQVMQATGVVIGFVIVAGVFLGVADFLAGKLMNYILTGHFK
jgi:preprotein translocase subunit SecE